jgi:DHA3 family macrolide efflux protein-like MFS transporter
VTPLPRRLESPAFYAIWAGQSVSTLGSELTGFALGVWVFERTESVSRLGLILLATTLPGILLAPLAGALIDRLGRRVAMLATDSLAALSSLTIAVLLLGGHLELWQILVLLTITASCEAFQNIAYAATISLLVDRERLGRANGLVQLGQAVPRVIGPALAGVLLERIGLGGVILCDLASYLVAVTTLLKIRLPRPSPAGETSTGGGRLLREIGVGRIFLRARPGLIGLLVLFAISNFSVGTLNLAIQPLVLGFASPATLGTLLSLASFGFVAGGLVMSAWGGPRRLMDGVLAFTLPFGLGIMLTGLRPSATLVGGALLLITASASILFGCGEALWQAQVPTHLQGRVFALRDMIVRSALLLAYVTAGPLADHLFEPRLAAGGAWVAGIGRLIGSGPGRGVGLMLVLAGALPILAVAGALFHPHIRRVEELSAVPFEAERTEGEAERATAGSGA